jgi:cytochrome P450
MLADTASIQAKGENAMHAVALPVLRQMNDLPGPRALPLIGNLLQMRPSRIHQDMENWSREFGPLFRVSMPGYQMLVVADHALIGQLLRERPATFRRPSISAAVAEEMGGIPGVFEAEGAAWRNQRRMVMQAFAPHAVKGYFPSLVKVAARLRTRWDAAARTGRTLDVGMELRLYTIDILAGLAFGSEVNTIETGDNEIQRHLDRLLPAVAFRSMMPFAYWRYFKLPSDRQLDVSVAATKGAATGMVAEAKARLRDDPARTAAPPNLLEAMLVASARPDSGVTENDVVGNVVTLLLAGEDTTSNSAAWLIYLLHQHPQALRRARDEVLRVAPDVDAMTVEQVDRLDFLEACVHEAMRLKPPAPYLPVEALEDTVVGDVQVPNGTLVWCVMRRHSVDDAFFPDAASFNPQRWLDENVNKTVSMPFGSGPRTCPGRYLALLEIKVLLAMLLARFEVESVQAPGGGEPAERMAFVMSPEALEMRLRVR